MKTLTVIFTSALLVVGGLTRAFAQSTAFTYQGRLTESGAPAQGIYDLRFTTPRPTEAR